MTALWAPFEVCDLAESERFYRALGLPVVDTFPGGVVFGVGPGGRIEIVQVAQRSGHPTTAIELSRWEDVDRLGRAVGAGGPAGHGTVFPRGHYGFVTTDPDGNRLLIWSEA